MSDKKLVMKIVAPFGIARFGSISLDFGKNGERLVSVDASFAENLRRSHPSTYKIMEAEAGRSVKVEKLKEPQEYTDAELIDILVSRYTTPGLFMYALRDRLMDSKGDVFPIGACLDNHDLQRECGSRGFAMVPYQEMKGHLRIEAYIQAKLDEIRAAIKAEAQVDTARRRGDGTDPPAPLPEQLPTDPSPNPKRQYKRRKK